jgi:uncharacterized protein
MKIYIDKIPEGGIELRELIQPEALLIDMECISFPKPIDVKADVLKRDAEIFVDVILETPVEYTCGKCLTKFGDIFKKKFNIVREVRPAEIVELDDEIRQEIILDCPVKIICNSECKGLCPNCGQNLNVAKCECDNTK